MKRFLSYLLTFVIVAGAGIYLFREPLKDAIFARVTSDMFVPRDDDAYDPGVSIGAALPELRARYRGQEITQLADFVGPNGMVLVVNRSVDW